MSAVVIYTPPPVVRAAVHSALKELPAAMGSKDAIAYLYASTLQEDPNQARRQIIKKNGRLVPEGPAAGLWQFEQGGGCVGVLNHRASRAHAARLCESRGIAAIPGALWAALPHDDVLAAACARLLLWTDHAKLPAYTDAGAEQACWEIYLRTWRPGAYHNGSPSAQAELRAKWSRNWKNAVHAVTNECAP
jgi:hypothetical protein